MTSLSPMVMFLEQSHVFFWKFCEDPTWFGWDIKLSFKTRPGNLDNSRHFCVWLLDYFHACPPRKCILWWIFSVTTLCKYKKYEMYVLMGLGMNLMINYTNNVWEPALAQSQILHMQTFSGRNHWQTILWQIQMFVQLNKSIQYYLIKFEPTVGLG